MEVTKQFKENTYTFPKSLASRFEYLTSEIKVYEDSLADRESFWIREDLESNLRRFEGEFSTYRENR